MTEVNHILQQWSQVKWHVTTAQCETSNTKVCWEHLHLMQNKWHKPNCSLSKTVEVHCSTNDFTQTNYRTRWRLLYTHFKLFLQVLNKYTKLFYFVNISVHLFTITTVHWLFFDVYLLPAACGLQLTFVTIADAIWPTNWWSVEQKQTRLGKIVSIKFGVTNNLYTHLNYLFLGIIFILAVCRNQSFPCNH